MNLIAKSVSVQTSFDLYNLTKAPNREKLVDIKGQTITLKSWALYEEENNKGEMVKILSLMTEDGKGYTYIGDLAEELARTRKRWTLYSISDFFDEAFFETKKVVYTPKV